MCPVNNLRKNIFMPYTLSIGQKAPNFSLLGTDGLIYTLDHCKGAKGFVVFFTCNHCPYVLGSDDYIQNLAKKFQRYGILFIGINANDSEHHKEDCYEGMVQRAKEKKFVWPYLHDPKQDIAKKYGALCTPHYFVFNQTKNLVYTGRAVDYPKKAHKARTHELQDALHSIIHNQPVNPVLTNPIGCNIKWCGKKNKWMPDEACSLV